MRIPRGRSLFIQQALVAPMMTASVMPSSRSVARALVDGVDLSRCDVVLELGCGTGVVTAEILRRMKPTGRLLAIEMNQTFVEHLRDHCRDPRLTVLHGSAEGIDAELGGLGISKVDAIVSSVGLATMDPEARSSVLNQASGRLALGGAMTQVEICGWPFWNGESGLALRRYRAKGFLRSYFHTVGTRVVLRNLPPAIVYTCRNHNGVNGRNGHSTAASG